MNAETASVTTAAPDVAPGQLVVAAFAAERTSTPPRRAESTDRLDRDRGSRVASSCNQAGVRDARGDAPIDIVRTWLTSDCGRWTFNVRIAGAAPVDTIVGIELDSDRDPNTGCRGTDAVLVGTTLDGFADVVITRTCREDQWNRFTRVIRLATSGNTISVPLGQFTGLDESFSWVAVTFPRGSDQPDVAPSRGRAVAVLPPSTPELDVPIRDDGVVELRWSAPDQTGGRPIKRYLIERRVQGTWSVIRRLPARAREVEITGLPLGRQLRLRLSANNGRFVSKPVRLDVRLFTQPSPPRNLQVRLEGTTAVATWDPPASLGGHRTVEYDPDIVEVGAPPSEPIPLVVVGREARRTVEPGRTYLFAVDVQTDSGSNQASVQFTVPAA
jgi:hypothetical protein